MTDIVTRAALFAKVAHMAVGQRRKYTDEPYHTHPAAVAQMVQEAGGTPEMIAAAHLHDVVEDTQVELSVIREEFGDIVAELVDWVTDTQTPEDGNRATRKQREREKLARAPTTAQTIKLADLIHNTESIVERDPGFAQVYLPEKRQIFEGMHRGDPKLYRRAMELLEAGEARVAQILHERHHCTYRVYLNGRKASTVFSEREAWDLIGQQPLGTLYEVRDADGNVRPEFIPY